MRGITITKAWHIPALSLQLAVSRLMQFQSSDGALSGSSENDRAFMDANLP